MVRTDNPYRLRPCADVIVFSVDIVGVEAEDSKPLNDFLNFRTPPQIIYSSQSTAGLERGCFTETWGEAQPSGAGQEVLCSARWPGFGSKCG